MFMVQKLVFDPLLHGTNCAEHVARWTNSPYQPYRQERGNQLLQREHVR